jgi:hypothetical protein
MYVAPWSRTVIKINISEVGVTTDSLAEADDSCGLLRFYNIEDKKAPYQKTPPDRNEHLRPIGIIKQY